MKNKKIQLAVLMVCLLLTGCSGKGSTPSGGGQSTAQAVSGGQDSSSAQSEISGTKESIQMLTEVFGGRSSIYSGQNNSGYYEFFWSGLSGSNILYTDFATATRVFLCNRPDCDHRNADCTSWISNTNGSLLLMPTDDQLYLLQSGGIQQNRSEEDLMHIWQMNPDGSDRKLLFTGDTHQISEGGVAWDGEKMYFPMDEWNDSFTEVKQYIAVLDLKTGELKLPYELTGYYWYGCSGREIIFASSEEVGQTAGAGLDVRPDQSSYSLTMYGWNADTGEVRTIGNEPIVSLSELTEDGWLYWVDGSELALKKMDLSSGATQVLCSDLDISQGTYITITDAGEDYVLLNYSGDREGQNVLVSPQSGEILAGPPAAGSETGKELSVRPLAEYGDKYLVTYKDELVNGQFYNADGTAENAQLQIFRLAFLPKADYLNGNGSYQPITDTVLN